MSILSATRRQVKPATVVLFAPSMVRGMQNRAFGLGLARERRLPVGPSAADVAEIKGTCPATAPSFTEEMDHFYGLTMSAAEYADFAAHVRSAMADRYAAPDLSGEDDEDAMLADMAARHDRYEAAELAEVGIVAPVATEGDVARPARKPRRKVETLRTRHRAAAKAAAASVETPFAAMTSDQLIDAYAALHDALPARRLGWAIEDVREQFPAVAGRLAAINAALVAL